jgi:hypothetical protein
MAPKKASDLLVVCRDLPHERQELTRQCHHSTRFGTGGDRIGLQMRLLERLPHMLGDFRRIAMMRLFEDCSQFVSRSCFGGLGSRLGLQADQGGVLRHFGEQLQRYRVVRFETGGELINQSCLTLDERVLIMRERFEFLDLRCVRVQSS